jgi:hypothetical protein
VTNKLPSFFKTDSVIPLGDFVHLIQMADLCRQTCHRTRRLGMEWRSVAFHTKKYDSYSLFETIHCHFSSHFPWV